MQESVRFWDKVAQKYAKSTIADIPSYEHKLAVTRQYFRPDSRVLELGCGTGSTALLHAPYVAHILATDIAANMLKIAREKAAAAGVSNISFEQGSCDDLNPQVPLDMVLALNLLHLVKDRKSMIEQAFNWLKPGGVFITSTACLGDSAWKYIGLIAPLGRLLGLMPPVYVFTVAQLQQSIIAAGFKVDYVWQQEKSPSVFMVAKKPA